jgi:ABC-type sugar transport system ATPase subunit
MELMEICDLDKSFPGVHALKKINFDLKAGEVHALVGENGAGKSTLIKIISGVYRGDSGSISINGELVDFSNPGMASASGIGTIYQDFELANNLSVAENISLGMLPNKRKIIDWKAITDNARQVLNRLQIPIDPNIEANLLGIGEQQIIEIARVISHDVKVLIMDEPTSALSNDEVEHLFSVIKKVTSQGVGVIYISHRLEEVFRISDRISVLRDGQTVGTFETKEADPAKIISLMLGSRNHIVEYKGGRKKQDVILEVNKLEGPLLKHPIDFQLHRGEIVGFAGLMGSGRTEILKSLFGLGGQIMGEIKVEGYQCKITCPQNAMDVGIALVPEDRRREGIFPNLSVMENMVISNLKSIKQAGIISTVKEKQLASENIKRFNVKTPASETLISTLSGGNQQKVIFAKWLATNPKIILLDEPTRGIDVGSKAEIYAITNLLVEDGLGVVLVSSELKELMDICDRILVIRGGQITSEVYRNEFDYNSITAMMMGTELSA